MKLAQIRDLLALIVCGSLSAATRELGEPQPGLTNGLGSLEAGLGAASGNVSR